MATMRAALQALADKMEERCGDHCAMTCWICELRNDLRLILVRTSGATTAAPRDEQENDYGAHMYQRGRREMREEMAAERPATAHAPAATMKLGAVLCDKHDAKFPGFALLVIGLDGEEQYLCDGMGDRPSRFFSRREAQSQKDFMWIGMEGDVQSINIVPYPKQPRVTAIGS